jgi:hypothetical protein
LTLKSAIKGCINLRPEHEPSMSFASAMSTAEGSGDAFSPKGH